MPKTERDRKVSADVTDRRHTLLDAVEHIVDNRGRTCPTADSGIPLIATNCIRNELLYPSYDKVRYVDSATHQTWFRGHPEPGDLLFVTKGTPGRVCLVPDPVNFCIAQDMVSLRADRAKFYPRFLFAVLRSGPVQDRIEQLHVGTLIPHFKKGDFDKLELPCPPMKTQMAIGDVYFEMSDKIELNRQMNRTLEQMAAAIFKAWFVDFEPVKAKAAGATSFATMPQEVFDTLPTEFVDSPLGPIPKGWAVRKLDQVIELAYGKALKAADRLPGTVPVYGSNGQIGMHDKHLVKGPGVVVGRKGNPGIVCWVDRDFFPIDTSFWVKPAETTASMHYLFHTLSGLDLRSLSADSAVPGLNRNLAYMSDTLVAEESLIQCFDAIATNLSAMVSSNNDQADTLSAMRDALLPKLLSGEVRVGAAEQLVEEVA